MNTQKGKSDAFITNKGIIQGDSLPEILFHLALRNIRMKISGIKIELEKWYAYDIVIVAKRREILTRVLEVLIIEDENMGLSLNQEKRTVCSRVKSY